LPEKLDHATIGKIKMVIGECEEKRVGVKVNNEARMEKRGKKEKLVTTFLEPNGLFISPEERKIYCVTLN
jgi:sugar lactone lactonase YvrE